MNLFKALSIVLEADDITKQVKQEQDQLNDSTDNTPDSDDDLNQTDDIFDLNDDNAETDPKDIPDDTDTKVDDEDNEDDDMGDLPPEEDTADIVKEETPEIKQKIKLRENMILFYNIISSNIKLLQEYRPSQNSKESIEILFNIISNLTDCKNILYKEITESFSTKSYPLLLKTYVSISRVYDLCQKSLELYFDNVKLIDNPVQKKNEKQKI